MNQITEHLWIGDIRDAQTVPLDDYDIERVITICQDSVEDNVGCEYEHFSFQDGPHDYELFKDATDAVLAALRNEEITFVHCHAGQSRSVMACTAALAVYEDTSFDQAFWKVRSARGTVHPSNELRLSATRYVTRHYVNQRNG